MPGVIYLGSLVINVLALGLPLVSLQVYDRIIPHRARETLALLMLALVIALVLDLALRTLRSALLGWRAMYFARQLEHEAVTRLLHARGVSVVEVDRPRLRVDPLPSVQHQALDAVLPQQRGRGEPGRTGPDDDHRNGAHPAVPIRATR